MNVIDNALSPQFFSFLQKEIFDKNFPWYYCGTSNRLSSESVYGNSFSHLILTDDKTNSPIGGDCRVAGLTLADKADLKIKSIVRIRLGLLEPKPTGLYVNVPHVDTENPHHVGLLYLNDSDGETIIYEEKYDPRSNLTESEYYDKILRRKLTVKTKIECKANRFIHFDGYTYHSSTCPTNVDRRVTMNFNFILDEKES